MTFLSSLSEHLSTRSDATLVAAWLQNVAAWLGASVPQPFFAVPACLLAAGGVRVGDATRPVLALQGAAPCPYLQETLANASAWLSSVAPLPGVAASATGA